MLSIFYLYANYLLLTFGLQVLDVERMVAKNTMPQTQDQGAGTNLENHPVIRTLYDHMEVTLVLKFP